MEGDLIVGRYGRSHLITLVERRSRFLLVLSIRTASSASVITELCRMFATKPTSMARSLTWDSGIEMSRHVEFSSTIDCGVLRERLLTLAARQQREHQWASTSRKTDLSVDALVEQQAVVDELNN